jgi:hypothetical protein
LIKILEGNISKKIGKKDISGYGEGNYFCVCGNTGFVDSVSGFVD